MKKQNSKYHVLLTQAKAQTKRNKDGEWNEEDLLTALKNLITVNVDEEKLRIAKAIVDSETKPGGTKPTGQLCLPGMGPYDYEPERLIRDDEGHVVEQDKSLPRHKSAESHRAAKHAAESADWAYRKREEFEKYSLWRIQQMEKGRTKNLTFGDFVRETEYFEPFHDVEEGAA